jgi:hypothetical protein
MLSFYDPLIQSLKGIHVINGSSKDLSGSAKIMLRLGWCIYGETTLIIGISVYATSDLLHFQRMAMSHLLFRLLQRTRMSYSPIAMERKHPMMPVRKNLLPIVPPVRGQMRTPIL